jgi:DNA-binding LacI/PurR family transcriptional regulator
MARNFSLRRHLSIGFLLPQIIPYSMRNPYTMQVIQGIGSVCQKYGYTLTLIPPLNESIIDAVRSAAVDGLITLGMQNGMDIVDVMKTRKLPFVTIDGTPSEGMPSVNIQDEMAAYRIMKLVLEQGHRHIAIISLSEDVFASDEFEESVSKRRKRGYERALKEYGLSLYAESGTVHQMVSESTLEDGQHSGQLITKMKDKITAIATMSDIVAIGCILYLKEHGFEVPNDISVVGFDNILEAQLITPALTTVDQPAGEKGHLAAEALFRMINGDSLGSTPMEIPFSIIHRESLSRAKEVK